LELTLLALAAAALGFQLIEAVALLFNASCDVLFIALCVRVFAAFRTREVAPISR
jgi:hypothetical protein